MNGKQKNETVRSVWNYTFVNNFSEQFLLKLTTGIKKRSEDFKKRMFVSQFQTLTLKKIKLMVSSLYSS